MNYLQMLIKNKYIKYEFKLEIDYVVKEFNMNNVRYILFCDGSGPNQNKKGKGSYAFVLYDYKYKKYTNARKENSIGDFFENELNALYNGLKTIRYINDHTYVFIDNLKLYNLIINNKDTKSNNISKINQIKIFDIKNILFENDFIYIIEVDRNYVKPADYLNNLK